MPAGASASPRCWVDGDGERALAIERGAYECFYAGVRDALRERAPMPVDPRDSVAALRGHRGGAAQRRDGVIDRYDEQEERP